MKRTKKVRLIVISSLITSVVLSSYFAVGLIRAKPAGDPRSYVVDICGPPPNQGGFGSTTASGLLACPTGQGAIAWGTDCTPLACQFGPGTTSPATSVSISFTWQNCCSANTAATISLNGVTLLIGWAQYGALLGRDFFTFTVVVSGLCAVFSDGTTATGCITGVAGILLSTGPGGVSNGGNLLTYTNAQGIVGIRAIVRV